MRKRREVLVVTAVVLMMALTSSAAEAQEPGTREVTSSTRSLVALQTRLRYTTMIVLPDDEEILDVICGDRDFWIVSATHNIAHVKPAKAGAATNLNLVTASGFVYSFLLSERSEGEPPDLKVYVRLDDAVTATAPKPRFYSATDVAALEEQLTSAKLAAEIARKQAMDAIASFQQQYPTRLHFVYRWPANKKPFAIRAIWHDGQFTYIKADAAEWPAIYELKDGKPSLLNFQVHNRTIVVPKVIEVGYLALGKSRLAFAQETR